MGLRAVCWDSTCLHGICFGGLTLKLRECYSQKQGTLAIGCLGYSISETKTSVVHKNVRVAEYTQGRGSSVSPFQSLCVAWM